MSDLPRPNTWNVNPEEARNLQQELRKQLQIEPLSSEVKLVAGADISFNKYESTVYAGFIILDVNSLQPVAHSLAISEAHFPYIPGLLSFREIPSLLKAWEQLVIKPDVVMVDGHGIAHPRRLGIAAHFGLATNTASMGVAKKKLFGKYEEPETTAGNYTSLKQGDETLGYVYRTKKNVKPVFISPGHKISLQDVLHLTSQCTGKYRLPEPTRQAHLLVNRLRRGELPAGYHEYPSASPLFL